MQETLSTLSGNFALVDVRRVRMGSEPILMAGILAAGNFAGIGATAPVAASQTLTSNNTNVSNNDYVDIDGVRYTYKTALTASTTAYEVLIGADADASHLNLARALNGSGSPGTHYGSLTPVNKRVAASETITAHVLTVSAKEPGAWGNGIKVSKSAATLTWGSTTLANGADAKLNVTATVASIAASEVHIGEVSTPADVISVTPVVEATALDAGDVVCDSTTITNAVRVSGGQAVLQSLTVIDKADQGAALDVYIMDTTGLTFGTLDAAPSISDTDAEKILAVIPIASGDWKDVGGAKVANLSGLSRVVEAASGRNLAFAVTTSGTPTYGAATALVFRFGFLW